MVPTSTPFRPSHRFVLSSRSISSKPRATTQTHPQVEGLEVAMIQCRDCEKVLAVSFFDVMDCPQARPLTVVVNLAEPCQPSCTHQFPVRWSWSFLLGAFSDIPVSFEDIDRRDGTSASAGKAFSTPRGVRDAARDMRGLTGARPRDATIS